MDARTEHLIALVKDGATLGDAGRVYGISGERVRQLLKAEGIGAGQLPGRGQRPGADRVAPGRELAPVIEAMWRKGMLYHEIAKLFDLSSDAVHRLICERVPEVERSTHTARRLKGPAAARLLGGMREAQGVLARATFIDAAEHHHAQALVKGWLVAYSQLAGFAEPTELAEGAGPCSSASLGHPSAAGLRQGLVRFEAGLRAGGLRESTIQAYLLGSALFVRWLEGDYTPARRVRRGYRA